MGKVAETLHDALSGERLDRIVSLLTGHSRAGSADLISGGRVSVDGNVITVRSCRVQAGQLIEVDDPGRDIEPAAAPDPSVALAVVYEDPDVVVVEKPPGLVVHPGAGNRTGTLVNGAMARFPEIAGVGDPQRPGVVHRIDKGTSGLLVLARSESAYLDLVGQFAARSIEREYVALVAGHLRPPTGMIDAAIGRSERAPTRMTVTRRGRPARTRYEVTAEFDTPLACSLLRCKLESGRTHQIRVHLAAIGHPVMGDDRYGGGRRVLGLERPFLHAASLGFVHPASGEEMQFESALPADLSEVLASLR